MSLRQSGTEKVAAFVDAVKGLITTHNSSSSAHSTEMAKKVNIAQGSGNSGKFLKVNSSGNVACESVTIPNITGKEDKSNKVTSLNSSSTDTEYPSAKCVYDEVDWLHNWAEGIFDDKENNYNKTTNLTEYSSDSEYPSAKCVYDELQSKASTSDISEKEDLSNKVTSWSSTTTDAHYPSEKLVKTGLDGKVDKETGKGLFSGSYNDLTNKPTIPSAYVHPSEKQCSYAYSHPSEKQCNYSYTHPSAKQCNATIPSASSSIPSADVTGGAIGSSSNYAKADHQHPLSSAYATSGHNHDSTYISKGTGTNIVVANGGTIAQSTFATSGHNHSGTYAPVSHTQASSTITDMSTVQVVVTYTDSTSETLTLFKQVSSQ